MKLGDFVRSRANDLGVGKLASPIQSDNTVEIQYFVSPAADDLEVRRVPVLSIEAVKLQTEQRVFWRDPEKNIWHSGRVTADGLVPAAALQNLLGPEAKGEYCLVRFPGPLDAAILPADIEVRWSKPIEDPTEWLACRTHDSPYWHTGRSKFVRSILSQRNVYRGLTGLASSSIGIFAHQLAVVRRILNDPIPRYILADEVGIGKTIEAGVIVRQHLLDNPKRASIAIVVPPHLVSQWQDELTTRFQLRSLMGSQIRLTSTDEALRLGNPETPFTMLVVDEAHQVSSGAHDPASRFHEPYKELRRIADAASHVLLLSATPVLHNEASFLAMLHLLDPSAWDLEDRAGFEKLISERQEVANVLSSLQDDTDSLFLQGAVAELRELLPDDERLSELLDSLGPLIDNDEQNETRQHAIRSTRIHMTETYKLHRRLIRTRRENNDVENDLPRRRSEIVKFNDPNRKLSFEALERWRQSASAETLTGTKEKEAKDLFAEFVEASLADSATLLHLLEERLRVLEASPEDSLHETESSQVRSAIEAITSIETASISEIQRIVAEKKNSNTKCVVFSSGSELAESLNSALEHHFPGEIRLHDADPEAVSEFMSDANAWVLVCDSRSEEGLNLQRVKTCIIHADLPFSANRLEQRIGRIDRLGSKLPHADSIVLCPVGGYEEAWCRVLKDTIKVFDKSVASLQHLLDQATSELRESLLHGGIEAFEDLSQRFLDEDDEYCLTREISRINAQEALDSVEEETSELEEFYDAIDEFEYESTDDFRDDLEGWVVRNMIFKRHVTEGRVGFRYRFRTGNQHTLLSFTQFINWFRTSLDGLATQAIGTPVTYPLEFNREPAQKHGIAIARVGNLFIDQMADLVRSDDRGIAFALWRIIPDYATDHIADIFYRFDFVVEANWEFGEEHVAGLEGISKAAIKRRADGVLPPVAHTLWVSSDLELVTDETLLGHLNWSYKTHGGPTDYPLLPGENWEKVEELGLAENWEDDCWQARQAAENMVRNETQIETRCEEAVTVLKDSFHRLESQMLSRVERLSGQRQASEEKILLLERTLCEGLTEAVQAPSVRVDSVGSVLLSGTDPFQESEA